MSQERGNMIDNNNASVTRGAGSFENALLHGTYLAECLRPKRGLEDRYEPIWSRWGAIQNLADADGRPLTDDERREMRELSLEMWPMADVIWRDTAKNTVCTEGKNLALDTFLAGSGYTVVGPFLGLISSVSWTATAAGDTMAQLAGTNGWREAGTTNAPQWTTPASGARRTTNAGWNAAASGSKALTAALSFSISTSGTVKGAFLVYGTGAVATNLDTNGKLMSAGVFSGGDKVVANLDTLNVSYSLAF